MTAETFRNSKYKPVLMPMPFGADSDSNYVIPSVESETDAPSFQDGFPSAFSSPKSNNGQYVTRQQMNGIGNLATRYEFFRRVGGLNTFDADFAIEIGGYPRGCVLDFLYDNKLYKVLSLVDNNKVDFSGAIPTTAQATAGIIQGSVDGYNWLYCNIANQVVKYNEIGEIPDFAWSGDGTVEGSNINHDCVNIFDNFAVAHFNATKNGYLFISGSCAFSSSLITTNSDYASSAPEPYINSEKVLGGFAIAVCKGSADLDDTTTPPIFIYSRGYFTYGFKTTPSGSGYYYGWNVRYDSKDVVSSAEITAGYNYTIYVVNKGGTITDSTLKIILQ